MLEGYIMFLLTFHFLNPSTDLTPQGVVLGRLLCETMCASCDPRCLPGFVVQQGCSKKRKSKRELRRRPNNVQS
jgi:hypothetical protein